MSAASVGEERQRLAEARRRWGENADPEAVAAWFAANAEVEYLAGCYGAALKDAGYARRTARDPRTVTAALRVIGCVQLERGDLEEALASLTAAVAAGAADLAFALAEAGRFEESLGVEAGETSGWARGRLARARLRAVGPASTPPNGERGEGFGWIQLDLADLETELARGGQEAALEQADVLVQSLEAAGVRAQLGDALLVRVHALERLGRRRELEAAEREIRELALSLGSRRLPALLG